MTISAKIIADSVNQDYEIKSRITTLHLVYPRFIHSELMTHRLFSRNASSSRAIPFKKMVQFIRENPAMPIHWGKNQPGMQASEEIEDGRVAKVFWFDAMEKAIAEAEKLHALGIHKQVVNRLLEPFMHINVLVSATEWENFFELRAHSDSEPEIHALALAIRKAMDESTPKVLKEGEWHLPYIEEEDKIALDNDINSMLKVSTARCARVSYMTFDGKRSELDKDLKLFDQLINSRPMHASPAEHQARAVHDPFNPTLVRMNGNFNRYWVQYRKALEEKICV